MLMNFKVASPQQNTPHQNISKIFQSQPVVLLPQSSNECAMQNQQNESISSEAMEVSVDPQMYLDEESIVIEDDEETVSAAEAKIETAKLVVKEEGKKVEKKVSFADAEVDESAKHSCTSCPETFSSSAELQNHVTTHLISSTSSTKTAESAIKKPLKKKKLKEDRLRKRKKIIIRINPSPKRSVRERAKLIQAKFSCAICKKSLSSKRNVEIHISTHKLANGKFRCDGEGCKKLFGKLENLLKHRESSHEKPVKKRKNQNEK
jgi:hypothetical protein